MPTALTTPTPTTSTPTRAGARRRTRVLVGLALACLSVVGVASAASATLSPAVPYSWINLAAPANDCTAYAGAHMRADHQAQGEAPLPCNLRHARTEVSVRLMRWNGSSWVALPWSTYTFNNSLGTGAAHIVTDPSGICGGTWWYTDMKGTVTTGTSTTSVRLHNDPQFYNPCA